jgi:predicted nucleic-acid-binding Zn-ribbon protein
VNRIIKFLTSFVPLEKWHNKQKDELNSKITEKNFYAEKACIICGSTDLIKKSAFFVPFLTKRMFNGKKKKNQLYTCKNCGFSYSSYRPTDEEMAQYYQNYRGTEYQRQREETEPSYTKEFNYMLGYNKVEEENRKKNLYNLLIKNMSNISALKNILDYGGDEGQFIPDELSFAKRFVYEVSGVKPLEGIYNISEEDLYTQHWDLIMCCHVLEHMPNPMDTINILKNLMHKNTYIYIELPYEDYFEEEKYKLTLAEIIKRPKSTLKKLLKKEKFNYVPIHEHINFFREKTLMNVFNDKQYQILDIGTKEISYAYGATKIIYCLVQKV